MELDFPALFEKHYDEIAGYIARREAKRSIAEDIAQATFLTAYDCRATYDPGKGSPRAWLFGIAIHVMQHHVRSERSGLRAVGRARSREVEPGDGSEEIRDRLDAHAMSGAIAQALTKLSSVEREVLTLRYWVELSYEEIAVAVGIPKGTVKSRLNSAHAKMRVHLASSVVEPDDG